jgi:hypothetical protein
MAYLKFYRRIRIFPWVFLNISKTGFSISFGKRGWTITCGRHGIRFTLGLPGSGLSVSEHVNYGKIKDIGWEYKEHPEAIEADPDLSKYLGGGNGSEEKR